MRTFHVSLADTSKTDDATEQGQLQFTGDARDSHVELVKIPDKNIQDIGPATGIPAAHQYDRNAIWLVVACDFPMLDPAALRQLKKILH